MKTRTTQENEIDSADTLRTESKIEKLMVVTSHSEVTSGAAATIWNASRLPSLDGWRAVSIGLVLAAHATVTVGFPSALKPSFGWIDGNFGVRLFFLISGFLITWLMIQEADRQGAISLTRFYARRALRILPVYFVYLLALLCISSLTPFRQSLKAWAANLTFTTDFAMTWDWHGIPWITVHLWSLAVEEQFYLIWPPIVALCGLCSAWRVRLLVLCIPIIIAPVARLISNFGLYPPSAAWAFSPGSFLNYFDTIAIGCLCAISVARWHESAERLVTRRRRSIILAGIALILGPHIVRHEQLFLKSSVAFAHTIQALGFSLILVQSMCLPRWGPYRFLNTPWVRHLGVLSYSIYIWQQLFSASPDTFGFRSNPWWMTFPYSLLAIYGAAWLSYHGMERPLLGLRARLHEATRTASVGPRRVQYVAAHKVV